MIAVEERGAVAVMRLEHGKVNAMDVELCDAIVARMAELGGRPVVMTGAGRAFSAGVDLVRVLDGGASYVDRLIPALSAAFVAVYAYAGPVVAAVNGAAIAGGCILACAADVRLAAHGAPIGATELRVGVPFPVAALEVLRAATSGHAQSVVLGAALYRDEAAVAAGLVHELVPAESLVERAVEVATELGAMGPVGYAMAKEQLHRPVLERIATDTARVDGEVARLWASAETAAAIKAQLGRIGS